VVVGGFVKARVVMPDVPALNLALSDSRLTDQCRSRALQCFPHLMAVRRHQRIFKPIDRHSLSAATCYQAVFIDVSGVKAAV
jgi:hypothetical protein